MDRQHFGNTKLLRRPGRKAAASRTRLALACSIAVHAAAATFLTAALQLARPSANPADETIALVFQTPPQAAQPAGAPDVPPMPVEADPPVPAPPLTAEAPPETLPAPAIAEPAPAVLPAPAEPPISAPPQDIAAPDVRAIPEPQLAPSPEVAPMPPEPTKLGPQSLPVPSVPPQETPPVPAAPPRLVPSRPAPRARSVPASRAASPPASTAPPAQPLAPSPGSSPGQTAPAPTATAEASSGWRTALTAWLQSHRTYPDEARRQAEEGTVLIRFSVGRDGQVLAVVLVRGSGSATLDEAAQAMFRGARMPPFTADMPQAETTVTVPIRYRLEQ